MITRFLPLLKLQITLLLIIKITPMSSSSKSAAPPIAKQGCQDHCGDVKIPYPFGIGARCYYNASYEILCKNNSSPVLKKYYNLEVISIDWGGNYPDPVDGSFDDSDDQTLTVGIPLSNMCGVGGGRHRMDLRGSPFNFAGNNVLFVKGCAGNVALKDRRGQTVAGCTSFCADHGNNNPNSPNTLADCHGSECCQALPGDMFDDDFFYEIALDGTAGTSSSPCNLLAGLIDANSVQKFANSSSHTVPVRLRWSTNNYDQHQVGLYCDSVSCRCNYNYEGNPHLPNGCQVARACKKCKHNCIYHIAHNYDSTDSANPRHYRHCINPLTQRGPILGFSLGTGVVLLIPCCYWLYRVIKKKREDRLKAKYFKRNGGLLLEQHMSSGEGAFDKTKVFRVTELKKATNNFHKNRVLGQGGQGTVYKGMLTDGKILAVKKSKLVDESQLEHFINELVILSQINHRNVVKLLGCCLETEVPLLIYEFIPNGTLYHLLHSPTEDFHVTWKMRLQIAAESADAVAYLHSSSSVPIYHRDIKSSNILLDEKYRAKVSDFGTSRAITIEQTHVTTCVMGTYGYLDPEYFQTNQFTGKSDVYSFGVVLVELITGKKPICPTKSGGWISLAYEFLSYMETSRLSDIVDARVSEEAKEEEVIAVANLARQCLHMRGKMRPSMKEIALVLDGIRSHKLTDLKDVHHEQAKFGVTDKCDSRYTHFRAKTFGIDDSLESSSSIDVQPLMYNTF